MKKTEWIWFNGKMVRWADANIHISTHALHYGTGVFEGIRCYETAGGPAVFRLDEHLDRMFNSAETYFQLPYTREQLRDACVQLISANHLRECYLRPIAFLAAGNLNVSRTDNAVDVAILSFPWDTYLGEKGLREGVRACFSSWQRVALSALPMNLKACGQYLNSYLAVTEAQRRGFNEALLLNSDGTLSEGSGENLFVVQDGVLITNGLESGILPGITRRSVIELAEALGIEFVERRLRAEDIRVCQEAFFTGTAAEVTPIREIDESVERAGGAGSAAIRNVSRLHTYPVPGPVTKQLQDAYFAAIRGRFPGKERWLTYVHQHVMAEA